MSCWRNISIDALNNVNPELVGRALSEMGLSLDTSETTVHGYEDQEKQVDGCLVKDGKVLRVGIVYADSKNNLKVVGDFWGTGLDEQVFLDDLAQQYVRLSIQGQLENLMGYTIDNVEVDANGDYVIEAYCA